MIQQIIKNGHDKAWPSSYESYDVEGRALSRPDLLYTI